MTYQIKLPVFEGPFDLLLFFIERDEIEIQEISISKITDDFLAYIQQLQELNIELASEFIFVASSLMQIKVRMLLPRIAEQGDSGEILDPRQDLIQKLIEYKRFKIVSEEIRLLEEQRFLQEKRGNITNDLLRVGQYAEPGEELDSFNLYKLMQVYNKVMHRYSHRKEEVIHTVEQYPYSIEEQKKCISHLLQINQKIDFQLLCNNSENKVQFVYNFLAILEMLQQELIHIQINLGFNNFWIAKHDAN